VSPVHPEGSVIRPSSLSAARTSGAREESTSTKVTVRSGAIRTSVACSRASAASDRVAPGLSRANGTVAVMALRPSRWVRTPERSSLGPVRQASALACPAQAARAAASARGMSSLDRTMTSARRASSVRLPSSTAKRKRPDSVARSGSAQSAASSSRTTPSTSSVEPGWRPATGLARMLRARS